MKDYINMFHSIVSEIHFWDQYDLPQKKIKILLFLENIKENDYLIKYFDHFKEDLQKKNLNFFLKSVNKQ